MGGGGKRGRERRRERERESTGEMRGGGGAYKEAKDELMKSGCLYPGKKRPV